MPKLIQISETAWVNLDLVTDIRFSPNDPRSRWDENLKQTVVEIKDRLLFSFAVGKTDSCQPWVEAVDHWARGLRDSLKFGSLGAACVISRGVQ